MAFTSPILGAILSGFVIDKLGGFYGIKTLPFAVAIACIGTVFSWLIPLSNDPFASAIYLWIVLFFGAIVLPICTGVTLIKIEPELRPLANSVANSVYMLLGNFPAPACYGLAVYIHGKKDSGWGMALLMYYSTFMVIFMLLAMLTDKEVDYRKLFSKKDNIDDAKLANISADRRSSSLGLGIPTNLAINEAVDNMSANPE